jgi:hypothetical protein
MKLSKLNNVVVKNSLYVLLFVISYTALLRYYNTEFFKVPPSTQPPTTVTATTTKPKYTPAVEKSILDPEYDFNKIVAMRKANYAGKEAVDFVVQLANKLVPEHKQLVAIAFYWFIMKKSQRSNGNKDNEDWAKSLNEVGLPYEMYANLLPQLLGMTVGAKGTLATLADSLTDNMVSVYIQRHVQYNKNFVPYDIQKYKDGLERIDWNSFKQQTSDVVELRPPTNTQQESTDFEQIQHISLLAFVWLNFLLALPQPANETTMDNVWKQGLADVGLPKGLYDSLGKLLYQILNNTKHTFTTVDEELLAPFEYRVASEYNSYVVARGKFAPADKTKYDQAFARLEKLGPTITNVSVDPSMYTKEYVEKVKMILNTNTSIPPPQVKDKPTPIEIKPIITAPVFKTYEPNQVNNNTSTETPKDKPTEQSPATATSTDVSSSTPTTSISPVSFFASISSKFLLYVLVSFVVSIIFIVLIVWGAISISKAKTAPNSTF